MNAREEERTSLRSSSSICGMAANDAVTSRDDAHLGRPSSKTPSPQRHSNRNHAAIQLNNRGVDALSAGNVNKAVALFSRAARLTSVPSTKTAAGAEEQPRREMSPPSTPTRSAPTGSRSGIDAIGSSNIGTSADAGAVTDSGEQGKAPQIQFQYRWVSCSTEALQSAVPSAAAPAAGSGGSATAATAAIPVHDLMQGRNATQRSPPHSTTQINPVLRRRAKRKSSDMSCNDASAKPEENSSTDQKRARRQQRSASAKSERRNRPSVAAATAAAPVESHSSSSSSPTTSLMSSPPSPSPQTPFLIVRVLKITVVPSTSQPHNSDSNNHNEDRINECPACTFAWAIWVNLGVAMTVSGLQHHSHVCNRAARTNGRLMLLKAAKILNHIDQRIRRTPKVHDREWHLLLMLVNNTLLCITKELGLKSYSERLSKQMEATIERARTVCPVKFLRPFYLNLKVWNQVSTAAAA